MRTEVKVGVAIGLVFSLVIVGYFVYQSHHANQAVTQAGEYNRTFGPAPVTPKPPEMPVSGGIGTTPTTAPAPAGGVPHLGAITFPSPTAGTGTTGTPGTGLRVTPLTPGLRTGDSLTPTPTASLERTYTVVSGDTLSSIAQKEYGEASKYTLILGANPGLDASHLRLNQKIKIPAAAAAVPAPAAPGTYAWTEQHPGSTTRPSDDSTASTGTKYIVQENDSLWVIAKKVYGDATLCVAIEKSNHGVTTVRKGQTLICPPLDEARRLSGVSGEPTTRPSTIAMTGIVPTSTHAGPTLAHAGTSTTGHAAAPADDGKPRFPVPD
jgi:nucleoid-associated protein YgaU